MRLRLVLILYSNDGDDILSRNNKPFSEWNMPEIRDAKEKDRIFSILRTYDGHLYTVVEIHYPGCTNREGRKILVFSGLSSSQICKLDWIDPHFLGLPESPIARFDPTDKGWDLAVKLADG